MKTIKGKTHWQVKDLREMLEEVPDDAVVFTIHPGNGAEYVQRPIYKNATSADDTEHYLYLGGAS